MGEEELGRKDALAEGEDAMKCYLLDVHSCYSHEPITTMAM